MFLFHLYCHRSLWLLCILRADPWGCTGYISLHLLNSLSNIDRAEDPEISFLSDFEICDPTYPLILA